jgi:hypothetical protein
VARVCDHYAEAQGKLRRSIIMENMCGLKQLRSARMISTGHALVREVYQTPPSSSDVAPNYARSDTAAFRHPHWLEPAQQLH